MKALLITKCQCKRIVNIRSYLPDIRIPLTIPAEVGYSYINAPSMAMVRYREFKYNGRLKENDSILVYCEV